MKSGWEEGLQLKAAWAVPLKMTKIKTLRATDGRTDGRVDGITLRGPRGPKNNLILLMSGVKTTMFTNKNF